MRRAALLSVPLLALGLVAGCGGGASQYYTNGYNFGQGTDAQNAIFQAVQDNGASVAVVCAGLHSRVFDPLAFMAGTSPMDTGPTQADNNSWAQGCTAGYDSSAGS
jgi:hypothetical protein